MPESTKNVQNESQILTASGKENGKPGRPTIEFDLNVVKQLARIQCTDTEIMAVIGMSRATFYNAIKANPGLREIIDQGREEGKVSIRRKQIQVAMDGNVPMLIHLGKNVLEQFDRQKVDQTIVETRPVINLTLSDKTNIYEPQEGTDDEDNI